MIEFLAAGPADGLPLVLHEGTPCGLVLYPPTVRAAAIRGLRVVLAARPGYEGSTPRPGRSVVDVAQDTAAVLDDLGAATFVTLGWSGGGPHALACAAALPGRCLAAGSIAGVAPFTTDGLDWLGGMAPENIAEFGAARRGEAALTEFLDREFDHVLTVCDDAAEACPVFPGPAVRSHWSIPDPARATGTDEEVLAVYRATLADLRERIEAFLATLPE